MFLLHDIDITRTSEPMPVDVMDTLLPNNLLGFLGCQASQALAVLSDLDGCLISGKSVLPHASELIARTGERLWVVSNNSSDTSVSLSHRLAGMGLHVPPIRILLAGEEAVHMMAQKFPKARVAMFVSEELRTLAADLGLRSCRGDEDRPIAALLARDPTFTMMDLERLMRLVHSGVPLWITNRDTIHPAADGTPVPETGALLAALTAGLPNIRITDHGKPAPRLAMLALQRAGIAARDAVFIGDTDATDGACARAAGIPFILMARPGAPIPTDIDAG